MLTKIIILSPIPLSPKLTTDFYINELAQENIKVEYWDFSPIFFNKHTKVFHQKDITTVKVASKKEFLTLLNNIQDYRNILIITGFTFCFQFLFVYRILNDYNFLLATFARGALPNFNSSKSSLNQVLYKLMKIFNPYKWRNITQSLYAKILKRIGLTKKIDIIFKAGESGLVTIGGSFDLDVKSAKKIIDINYFDYDKYIAAKRKNSVQSLEDRYIVFLDDYLPSHPDFDLMSMSKVDAYSYYKELNTFLSNMEALSGLKVVIAAHPKAVYNTNPFNDRIIYFGQTLELVMNADTVLSHASSSLSFAVCCHKKIILMTSNEIKNLNDGYLDKLIMGFQHALDCTIVNISNEFSKAEITKTELNLDCYNKYKYTYLTNKTSEKDLTLDIFMNFIKSYKGD